MVVVLSIRGLQLSSHVTRVYVHKICIWASFYGTGHGSGGHLAEASSFVER
jgi:hypothetical protein